MIDYLEEAKSTAGAASLSEDTMQMYATLALAQAVIALCDRLDAMTSKSVNAAPEESFLHVMIESD